MVLNCFELQTQQWEAIASSPRTPQLCGTSSWADMEKARKIEPSLEFYKVHTSEGKMTRALRIFARETL